MDSITSAILRTVIEEEKQRAIAVTLNTLAKRIKEKVPIDADVATIKNHIRDEIKKCHKLITLHEKMGDKTLQIEIVILYSIEELLFRYRTNKMQLKGIDAELDTLWDY